MAHLTDDEKAARMRALNEARAADESALSAPVAQPDVGEDFTEQMGEMAENTLRELGLANADGDYSLGHASVLINFAKNCIRVSRTPPSPPAGDAQDIFDDAMFRVIDNRCRLDAMPDFDLRADRAELCYMVKILRTRLLATPERGTDAREQTARKAVNRRVVSEAIATILRKVGLSHDFFTAQYVCEALISAGMIAGPVVTEAHLHAALEFLAAEDRIEAVAAMMALIEGRAP